MSYTGVRIPKEPFQAWIEERIAAYEKQGMKNGVARLARNVKRSERVLRRYRYGLTAAKPNGHGTGTVDLPTDTFDLEAVEEMLENAGVFLWEVYE